MTRRFRQGLVVGKLSPLHRGHELLLRTAQAQCERLACISYSSPELPGCGANARRRWMSELFPAIDHLALDHAGVERVRAGDPSFPRLPANTDSELAHRQFVAHVCLRLLRTTVDAVFTSETYGDGFAAQLQHDFRAAGHAQATVQHVLVDLERRAVPISATAVRADATLRREYLSPVVYASFVRRVCLLGGESSGKTTLARLLASTFETNHVEEYGRELWVERGGQLSFDDFLLIGKTQLTREEEAARVARELLFCDTSPLTTLLYCLEQFGAAPPELHELAARRYDVTFVCAPDFPFVQDGTRRDAAFRAAQHDRYLAELARTSTPFVLLEGPISARLEQARRALEMG